MKIVSFVGEKFYIHHTTAYTKPTSAAFLQDAIGSENVVVCSPAQLVDDKPTSSSTEVSVSNFYRFPDYTSTKSFLISALLKPKYLSDYCKLADDVIDKYTGSFFWIRTPSIGSIVFGLRVLKKRQKLLHHMCADASNTWRDQKYSFIEKGVGFIVSRIIRILLAKICAHPLTINLCTGDVLERFAKKYSPNQTFQFVDLMVKPSNVIVNQSDLNSVCTLLFVGRVVADKGVFDLVDVVKTASSQVRAIIVGDGPDLDALKKYTANLGLLSRVEFTGQLKHSELPDLYQRADIVCVPSNNFYEGFPRVIMEAWSHSKPVIVSDVGGVKAFVQHGHNGMIFKPGNVDDFSRCLNQLLTNQDVFSAITAGVSEMKHVSSQDYWMKKLIEIVESKHVA